MNKTLFVYIFLLCTTLTAYSQDKTADSTATKEVPSEIQGQLATQAKREYDPLAPSKAAFYSAILPGLGQVYNRSYWKVPIVYGAIGTSMYVYSFNNTQYKDYRYAYKRRRAGFQDDQFYDIDGNGIDPGNPDITDDALEDAQNYYQRNRDLSLLVAIGFYALNIIDANVNAHLKQFNVSEDLTFDPYFEINEIDGSANYGFSLNYKF